MQFVRRVGKSTLWKMDQYAVLAENPKRERPPVDVEVLWDRGSIRVSKSYYLLMTPGHVSCGPLQGLQVTTFSITDAEAEVKMRHGFCLTRDLDRAAKEFDESAGQSGPREFYRMEREARGVV